MDLSLFFAVFDLTAFLYAAASGLAFGATVLLYLSLRIPARTPLPSLHMGLIAAGFMAAAGTLFFAGQVVQAYTSDPLWLRAVGRMALWEVFSVGIGIGLAVTRSFAGKEPKP